MAQKRRPPGSRLTTGQAGQVVGPRRQVKPLEAAFSMDLLNTLTDRELPDPTASLSSAAAAPTPAPQQTPIRPLQPIQKTATEEDDEDLFLQQLKDSAGEAGGAANILPPQPRAGSAQPMAVQSTEEIESQAYQTVAAHEGDAMAASFAADMAVQLRDHDFKSPEPFSPLTDGLLGTSMDGPPNGGVDLAAASHETPPPKPRAAVDETVQPDVVRQRASAMSVVKKAASSQVQRRPPSPAAPVTRTPAPQQANFGNGCPSCGKALPRSVVTDGWSRCIYCGKKLR